MSQEVIFFEKALDNVNSILRITGLQLIYDNVDTSFLKRLRRRLLAVLILLAWNPDLVAEFAWFVNGVIIGRDLFELTYPAPFITYSLLANVKAYYFLKNENHVNYLISTLRKLQLITVSGEVRSEVEMELRSSMNFVTRITNLQYWLNYIAIASLAILPFITMGMTYFEREEIQLVLPYVVLYPFDVYDKRIYPFKYLHELWTGYMVVFMIFGLDSVLYACSTFIQIQFRYLSYDLERIITRNLCELRLKEQIAVCIKRHRELIRCVSLMERIYAKSTLFNVVSSSILICLTGFNVTAIPSKILLMPFIGFASVVSLQIFLFCYFGDIIMRSSLAISDGVYNCQWYNADKKVKKNILLVLIRAQKPCKLTAYGFSDITLPTFARILSTAWSYFTLLYNLNGSNVTDEK